MRVALLSFQVASLCTKGIALCNIVSCGNTTVFWPTGWAACGMARFTAVSLPSW